MNRVLVTPPTQEPLPTSDLSRHLRLDSRNVEPSPDAPSVVLGTGVGNVNNGAHRHRVTFVTANGETDGGQISAAVTVIDKTVNGKIALANIPIGGSAVIARNLYRTIAGGSDFFFVATIADNTTELYTDTTADSSLGVGVPVINTTYDVDLADLQTRARQHLENSFGRAFLTQTWRVTLDRFPCAGFGLYPQGYEYPGDTIELPMPVLQSVTSITYVDTNGATQTLATSVYDVDTDHFPGRVILKYGQSWPSTRAQRNAVTVTFVAGFAAPALVPRNWTGAIKLLVGRWYHNPEEEASGTLTDDLERTINGLMWPDRFIEVA